MNQGSQRVLRHTWQARWCHGVTALSVVVLVLTGYALADALPARVVGWLGGHAVISDVHDFLGLGFAAIGLGWFAVRWQKASRWLGELCRVQRQDGVWLRDFVQDFFTRARGARAWHAGRLDPLQRWVLALALAMLFIVTVSGLCLYFAPAGWRWVFVVAIRAHVYANAALVMAVLAHVLAGLGVLPTHRGIWRSMWGDGTVPLATAQRLWPAWTQGQLGALRHEVERGQV